MIVLLISLACGLTTLWLPLGRDHGEMLFVSDLMLHGGAPYKDAWLIRPPGLLFIYGAAIAAFGKTTLTLRLLDIIWQSATALALAYLGRKFYNDLAGFFAGILYSIAYFLGNDYWNLGNGDAFIALPATLAMISLLPSNSGSKKIWDFASGLFIGIVFLIRYNHGLIFLPAIAIIFAYEVDEQSYHFWNRLRRLAVVMAGFIACVGLFVAYLYIKGALKDFFYILFVFLPKYAVQTYDEKIIRLLIAIASIHIKFGVKFILITIPAFLSIVFILVRERKKQRLVEISWLLAALIGIVSMLKFFGYHWLPLFAPLSLLAGLFFELVHRSLANRRIGWGLIGLAIACICVVSFFRLFGPVIIDRVRSSVALSTNQMSYQSYWKRFGNLQSGGDFSASANYLSAEYLMQHTTPGEPVFIWGNEALIYYLADRYPPTRFFSNYPIIAKWHSQSSYQTLLSDLRRKPPVFILLVSQDVMPWVTGQGRDSLTLLGLFPELRQFILDHYELTKTIENIHITKRKEN